jgi:hypothetical protein
MDLYGKESFPSPDPNNGWAALPNSGIGSSDRSLSVATGSEIEPIKPLEYASKRLFGVLKLDILFSV